MVTLHENPWKRKRFVDVHFLAHKRVSKPKTSTFCLYKCHFLAPCLARSLCGICSKNRLGPKPLKIGILVVSLSLIGIDSSSKKNPCFGGGQNLRTRTVGSFFCTASFGHKATRKIGLSEFQTGNSTKRGIEQVKHRPKILALKLCGSESCVFSVSAHPKTL